MKNSLGFTLLVACVLLTACGPEEGRGGLTAEEERQLDEAARMLDDNMIDASPDSLGANEAELEAMEAAEAEAAANATGNAE